MMLRPLLAAGILVVTLAGLLPGTGQAAQDRLTYAPNGAPSAGFYVNNLLTFPGTPNLAYVALRQGGVFKSVDNGATWAYSGNGINGSANIYRIQNKGGSTTELYVATLGDAGFYKTVDGGANWAASNTGLACHYVRGIVFDGANIMVSTACDTNSGFYLSTDSGATWSRTFTSLPDDFRAWTFFRGAVNEIYVTGNYGVYRSTDNGVTFAPANGAFPNTLPVNVSSQIFAFTRRSTGPTTGVLVAHPEGNSVYYSTDNGANWFAASGLPANGFALTAFLPVGTTLYFPIDGAGLYQSSNNGLNWAPASVAGLPAAMVRQIFPDPNNANLWWAATLGGVYQSSGAGNNGSNYSWTKTSTGLIGGAWASIVSPTISSTLYATSETVYQSTDGGATWSNSDTGIAGTTANNGSVSIVTHGAAPSTFYATTTYQGVYKSTNAGGLWAPANSGLAGKPLAYMNLQVAPSDPNTLYATANCGATGSPGGVYKTTSGAASWTDVGTSASLTSKCFNSVTIHPTDPNTVYVATGHALYLGTNGGGLSQSSNGSNAQGGLYKSTDGGASWTFINPGGVPFPVSNVTYLFSNPNVMLLRSYRSDNLDRATSVSGLYLSQDGGNSWIQLLSNEKVTQARLVQTPFGRIDAYVSTNGYFDQPSNGDLAFKCVDLLSGNGFSGENCIRLNLGANTRALNRFVFVGNRLAGVTTTSGIAKQSYRFLGPDFNNDGAADVLWRQTDGRNFIWNLKRSNQDQAAVTVDPNTSMSVRSVPSPWVVGGLADFNKDGHTDILWRNTATGDNYVYLMDNGNVVGEGYLPNVPPAWTVSAVGDFNGDGYADIWWNNGPLNYMYLLGIPSGNFPQVISEGFMPAVYAAGWAIAGTGDFDGDGKADIWYRNSSTGDNYLYLLNGMTITNQGYTANVPASWTIAGFGDFNGDGTTDVLWREGTFGYNYLYPMSGLTVLGTAGYLPTVSNLTWTVQGTGDTNKDGISDILWRQNSTGYNFVWRMNGTQVQSMCGNSIGCSAGVLPSIDEAGWGIVNK